MNGVEELLTEYAGITGRPLATISVSEYLELKKYSEGVITPITTQFEMPGHTQQLAVKEPESTVVPISDIREEKAVKKDVPEAKPRKSSAFAMMKSIGG